MSTRDALDAQVSEKAFQAQLVRQLREWGWWTWHNTIAYRSGAGWPDLFCVRGERVVVIECKKVGGKVTPAQQETLDRLQDTGKIEAYVFRPGEWDAIAKAMWR